MFWCSTLSVEWGDVPTWVGAIATVGALVAAVAAALYAMRVYGLEVGREARAAQDRKAAEYQAERAEAAARLTEEYTYRVVIALEALAENGSSAGSGGRLPRQVRWSLRWQAGDTYILENEGEATAESVEVVGHPSLGGIHPISGGPHLAEGEALTFMAGPSMATSDYTITVRWLTDGREPSQEWRYPLPYRSR